MTRHRKSRSLRVASSAENCTSSVYRRARWIAASLYLREIEHLGDELSMTDGSPELRRRAGNVSEPYRALLREVAERLARTRQWIGAEAGRAFGNPAVFLEKYIPRAKHIEVQILGDQHGNVLHLHERDCSVQRRHQKVIEVAPSYGLPERVIGELCEAAVRLAREIRYDNAGTIEFLYDLEKHE